ncbi:MAG: phospholipase D-like domain-containing protein [Thermoanaerobaculia bacterium]
MRTRTRTLRPALSLAIALALLAGCTSSLRVRYLPTLTSPRADPLAAFTIASGNEPVPGNSARLLQNGDEIFPAMLEAIASARSSIHFESYIYRDGQIARQMSAALAERARAGVSVRLLLDAIGSAGFGEENQRLLEEAGATVVFFRPLSVKTLRKIHLRTHRKVLVVDGRVGFVGGVCIADEWMGDAEGPDRWRETVVRVEGPVARQLQAAFGRAWLEATDELLAGRALYPTNGQAGEAVCQVMDSTPGFDSNPARLSFLVAVGSATKSIDLTSAYFVLDRTARRSLVEAVKRGVRVRLLLQGPHTDHAIVRYAGRNDYTRLLEAGVEIWEYQQARLHAKTMAVDGKWASVGSTNVTNRSFTWNYESNVHVFDLEFAGAMLETFERDLTRSHRITLEEWKDRGLGYRLLEWFYAILGSQY